MFGTTGVPLQAYLRIFCDEDVKRHSNVRFFILFSLPWADLIAKNYWCKSTIRAFMLQ
jgi:hypothetical protein